VWASFSQLLVQNHTYQTHDPRRQQILGAELAILTDVQGGVIGTCLEDARIRARPHPRYNTRKERVLNMNSGLSLTTLMTAALLVSGGAKTLLAQDQQAQPSDPSQQSQQQRQTSQQQQQQRSEQSKQELKVSEQETQKQVTDANKASKVIGMQVKNKQDEDLGKIKDLVVDFQSGKIAYAVLSSGGTFGFGGKMVAVPIEAFTLKPGEKALIIDLPKQQLSQAPGFTENDWPNLDAAQTGKTIGLAQSKSPQEMEAAGATGSQSQQAKGKTSGSVTDLQQLSASADPSTLEGKQVDISSAKADETIGQNLICVSSETGQKVLVKSRQSVQNIQPGQKVKVTGRVRKMPSDPAQLGLDQQAAQKFQDQKVYIEATQITPSNQNQ
jgi:sporulation protein YlmC with PRC-barrel domain